MIASPNPRHARPTCTASCHEASAVKGIGQPSVQVIREAATKLSEANPRHHANAASAAEGAWIRRLAIAINKPPAPTPASAVLNTSAVERPVAPNPET